jgi:hypothetical protein
MNPQDSYYCGTKNGEHYVPGTNEARQADIQGRAYQLWEEAGCPDKSDLKYWLLAEKEFFAMTQDW